MLKPSFRIADPRWREILKTDKTSYVKALRTTFAMLEFPARPFAVALSFVDDSEIQALNAQYRHMDKPTNVLSFPLLNDLSQIDGQPDPVELGDIIIAYDTTSREAIEQGKSLTHHVTHLLVHGFLHLLGYDHLTDDEAEEMEDLETEILATLGIADPYLASD